MINVIFHWVPRILVLVTLLFFLLFSLDCFGGSGKLTDKLACLVMSNIPTFILVAVLIYAWKNELIAGILIIVASIFGTVYFDGFGGNSGVLALLIPLCCAGILFVINGTGVVKSKRGNYDEY